MSNREEQIRLHHQKWKKWKNQMSTDMFRQNGKKQGKKQSKPQNKPQESGHSYAARIIGTLKTKQNKQKDSMKLKQQLQSNSCSVCQQLMIPPRKPMTLFPCGHNMCELCLLQNSSKKQLKTKKCKLCDAKIDNYAQNRSLMNIICLYTDNKHLIQKEQPYQQYSESSQIQTINKLRLRCEILDKQKKTIAGMLSKQRNNKQVLTQVIQQLKNQKKRLDKQTSAFQQEMKLIEDFLSNKKDQLQNIKQKIASTEQKKRIVQKTLEPLKFQKQKLLLLQAARKIDS